jgi:hypothetical protein
VDLVITTTTLNTDATDPVDAILQGNVTGTIGNNSYRVAAVGLGRLVNHHHAPRPQQHHQQQQQQQQPQPQPKQLTPANNHIANDNPANDHFNRVRQHKT